MNILPPFILFTDLWGPSPTLSLNGYRYYIHFIDGCTKFTTILVVQTHRLSKHFTTLKLRQNFNLIAKLKTPNLLGVENTELSLSFSKTMVFIIKFLVQRHQQSGTIERRHRHIVEIGLTLLTNASMPLKFWNDRTGGLFDEYTTYSYFKQFNSSWSFIKVPPKDNFVRVFGFSCFRNNGDFSQLNSNFDLLDVFFLDIAWTIRVISAYIKMDRS